MESNILGMTEKTERVYAILVGLPQCTAAELADACGMSAAAVGRLLSGMVEDGLAARAAGRPPRFSATAPDVAITALIQEREQQLTEMRAFVHRLMETHRGAARVDQSDLAVELLTSREDISSAVRRLTAGAKHEVRAFDRPPYVDRAGSNLDEQLERLGRSVAHRVVYDQEAVARPGRMRSDILPSIRAGEQARVRPELPMKLVIRDRQEAIIPFSLGPGGQSAAYLIHACPMLLALESLFEAEWDRAAPLQDTEQRDGNGDGPPPESEPLPGQPDPATHSLLTLLAAGLNDAAIARIQGWSDRTTQRRIHRLMAELGAATRFQACFVAARRGWL
jgi:DNA-binding CsgD family transcriptional regulator